MDYRNPSLIVESSKTKPGSVGWRSPSNLAIIKYWGKHGVQLPRNPSISFTLENAYTNTWIDYKPKSSIDPNVSLDFFFNNQPNDAFKAKVHKFLSGLTEIFPFLKQLHLTIRSTNSFPHSAGIASSASSMSALALCLCSMEKNLFGTLQKESEFKQKASYLARLGSGSACRSIYGGMAIWGVTSEVENASNEYAVPFSELHEVFKTYHDDILIISKGEKSVSSRVGHELMDSNIYAQNRYEQARQRFRALVETLRVGDVDTFGKIAEAEALSLHALMLLSNPAFILLKPNTIAAIEKLQQFRNDTRLPLYFSLDAGPNLHLLYPENIQADAKRFIKNELVQYCENGQYIEDKVGKGPIEL
ncbi:MAG: diphosphomevalonate decarboxylase [Saprospiraceae bacterium]|nr:diphosphomevalonate decarboxylase [Saprospiraceae bacterium]